MNTLTLYHMPLSPFCRKLRLALREKAIDFSLIEINPWKKSDELLKLNHACQVPVLIDKENETRLEIPDSNAIFEYIEEKYPDNSPLLPSSLVERAETRRLVQWFDIKFYNEVTLKILSEKVNKRFFSKDIPDSSSIRQAAYNLKVHLKYMSWILYRRSWLSGSQLTIADFAAAAHLSVLDYLSDVPWDEAEFALAKKWYSKIKSRPAFRALLNEYIDGFPMPSHYPNLDF